MQEVAASVKHVVVGLGEVGKAVREVLQGYYTVVDGRDLDVVEGENGKYDVVHICFPCNKEPALFVRAVHGYAADLLTPGGLIVVHSTVPVGTTDAIGDNAVHSPIRGVHPNLVGGIRTFVKYFGGSRAVEAANLFYALGIHVMTTPNSKNTEALKLWDTTQYGWNIILEKAIHKFCAEHGLDFDIVYTDANKTYNSGYATLGMGYVARPVLKHFEGKIGGHCVVPNAKLIGDWVGDTIVGFDEGLEPSHTHK